MPRQTPAHRQWTLSEVRLWASLVGISVLCVCLYASVGQAREESLAGTESASSESAPEQTRWWMALCQDGACNGVETHETCPQDCSPGQLGAETPYCSDRVCGINENCSNCAVDCGRCNGHE